ncbi:hypothetical protein F2Q69_00002064 [Brassica cretica]|uniref:Uncharacterized protein n=1 Tax=Brassica cretica TaxID=69181 RepID=A0A8S9NZJ5_BRACR|nr:hypothetical protein F2Q69_00002064 [Brassica cretica]
MNLSALDVLLCGALSFGLMIVNRLVWLGVVACLPLKFSGVEVPSQRGPRARAADPFRRFPRLEFQGSTLSLSSLGLFALQFLILSAGVFSREVLGYDWRPGAAMDFGLSSFDH